MPKLELLSPAGGPEQLEAAVSYGADAVYLGGTCFNMRASSVFDGQGLQRAAAFAHGRGVKVYLTCNTLPTDREAQLLPDFLKEAAGCGVDALIVADVGVLALCKRLVPELPVHISTQAGVTNFLTANTLYEMGASRVVLARELPLEEIRALRDKTPPELELEAFCHGAMCMSVSGRCLISSYLTHRDANRGECAQPCRWKYHLVEEKRPGQYYPVIEGDEGSYLLNAQDLCMLPHLDKLADAGVMSMKIEGRAKSAYYTAAVTNAYRGALDALLGSPRDYHPPDWCLREVEKVSHREYSTGFYLGKPSQCYQNAGYIRDWDVIAVVTGESDGALLVSERNRFSVGETAELMLPGAPPKTVAIRRISVPGGEDIKVANHPMQEYLVDCGEGAPVGAMLRRSAAGA